MSRTSRLLITTFITIAVALTGFQPSAPAADPASTASADDAAVIEAVDPVGLEIHADGAEWRDLVEWAEGRFAAVGLEMPDGIVSVTPGSDLCGGNSGMYRPGDVPEVQICVDREPSSRISRFIVLHELAHLWAENRLDEDTRVEFLDLRRLAVWVDGDTPSYEWGAEHAAEVLSWGLMDEPVLVIRIDNASPEALTAAFAVLTGTAPLVTVDA